MERLIERLAIVGDGLIGRSVQLAWRRRHADAEVIAFDRGDDLAPLATADAVVLAAPVDVILALLPRLPTLAPQARFITDTGSTKQLIAEAASAAGLPRFVPGHPMAGGTTTGPDDARADLFDGRTWFLLPGRAEPGARSAVASFVGELGARVVPLEDDGREHDRLVAAISHLPQVVATTLRDTTRRAASHASMWAPILATNATALAPLLGALADDLTRVAQELGDREAMEELFARAHRFPFDP